MQGLLHSAAESTVCVSLYRQVCGSRLFTGSGDSTVQIFNIEVSVPQTAPSLRFYNSISLGTLLAFAPPPHQTWERVHQITCHGDTVSGLAIVGKVLVTACFDKLVRCFDMEVSTVYWTIELMISTCRCICIVEDNIMNSIVQFLQSTGSLCQLADGTHNRVIVHMLNTAYSPRMSPETTHKLMGFYIHVEVLILGVIL